MKVTKPSRSSNRRRLYTGLMVAALFLAPLPVLADSANGDAGASLQPAPAPAPSSPTPTPAPSPAPADSPSLGPDTATANDGAAGPQTSENTGNTATSDTQNSQATTIHNQVGSDAASGTATVHDNYLAGDATTGKAQADATVLTVANSSTNFGTGSNFTAFTQDVYGDWQQNIVVDPSTLAPADQTSATSTTSTTGTGTAIQRTVTLTDILNDINLSATSGDASVHDNYQGGNATSGNASALANIINIVGSSIGAQRSFLGIINIYGNLKGDILVPSSFVDSLLDSNGSRPAAANTAASNTGNFDFTSANNTKTTIDNNVTAGATSGNATVSDNHSGGNATTGDATTNITVYNLTGQAVVAKNSLLVFVNVLGKWVGMIVPAPGSTAASLTGGAGPAASVSGQSAANVSSSTDTTTHITNNISVNAASGNASVNDNYQGGNATSGKASAGVNLLNITNSNFSLGDWFGTLFINVLGSWAGNFGIQTDVPATGPSGSPKQPIQDVKVFKFEDAASVTPANTNVHVANSGHYHGSGNNGSSNSGATTANDSTPPTKSSGMVLSTHHDKPQHVEGQNANSIGIDMVALVAIVAALTLLLALVSLAGRHILQRLGLLRPTPTTPGGPANG